MLDNLKLLKWFFLFVHLSPFAPEFEFLDDSSECTWMDSFLLSLSVLLVPHGFLLLHHESNFL